MPDRAIMGHTPPDEWRQPFKKLQRGQLDAKTLAPEVFRSLAKEAKKGALSDAPEFLIALRAGVSGEVSLEFLRERLRTVERNALYPDFAASMRIAAASMIEDIRVCRIGLDNVEHEFFLRSLVARYNYQFPAPVEAKLCEKNFGNDMAAMDCWKESLDVLVVPMITHFAEQVGLDLSGQGIYVPPLRRNRHMSEALVLDSEVEITDVGFDGFIDEDESD